MKLGSSKLHRTILMFLQLEKIKMENSKFLMFCGYGASRVNKKPMNSFIRGPVVTKVDNLPSVLSMHGLACGKKKRTQFLTSKSFSKVFKAHSWFFRILTYFHYFSEIFINLALNFLGLNFCN